MLPSIGFLNNKYLKMECLHLNIFIIFKLKKFSFKNQNLNLSFNIGMIEKLLIRVFSWRLSLKS